MNPYLVGTQGGPTIFLWILPISASWTQTSKSQVLKPPQWRDLGVFQIFLDFLPTRSGEGHVLGCCSAAESSSGRLAGPGECIPEAERHHEAHHKSASWYRRLVVSVCFLLSGEEAAGAHPAAGCARGQGVDGLAPSRPPTRDEPSTPWPRAHPVAL